MAPSSIKSADIKINQLDDTYYSPCANTFTLKANCLAFETLQKIGSTQLNSLIDITLSDLTAAMTGDDKLGYCSQHLREEGITSLLSSNISKCFTEYCQNLSLDEEIRTRVSIMHQCILNTEAGKGEMDIAMFYQFHEADVDFVHQPCEALFPLMFIEFTKLSTVDSKLPQAALYANHLFRLMKFDVLRTFVPLIGVVMSDREMLFRLY